MFGSIVVLTLFLVRLVIPFILLLMLGTYLGQRNQVKSKFG